MNTIIKRTTLLVRSCERSSTFYRDVFGMTVYYDDVIELGGVGLAAGNKSRACRRHRAGSAWVLAISSS